MTEDEIPQELIDILDARAHKVHKRQGVVVTTLAEILTKYDEIKEASNVNYDSTAWPP